MSEQVSTKQVGGRRELRFSSLDEVLQDAERLAAGRVRELGNWSLGQVLMHLARSIDASVDGAAFRAPWPARLASRLFKKRILNGSMPAGFRLPQKVREHFEPGETSTEAGLKALREATARYLATDRRASHPLFGSLTESEWDRLHLRHAELHLSFIVPAKEAPGPAEET